MDFFALKMQAAISLARFYVLPDYTVLLSRLCRHKKLRTVARYADISSCDQ
jgi:hypothetical protein